MPAHIQGTPVKFRDGPAAVIDVMGNFLRQMLHYLSAIVEKLLTRDAAESDSREGMQRTHRESEDLPLTGRDVTFLGEVRAES
jgi:hypothetical protein